MPKFKQSLRRLFPQLFVVGRAGKLMFSSRSFLVSSGYVQSVRQRRPCRPDGSPLPWMNYQIVHFLEQRLDRSQSLFEYGSGYSTRFYAQLAGHVTSVEHHQGWYQTVAGDKPDNVVLLHLPLSDTEAYCQSIARCQQRFDVVVIDGRERVRCMAVARDYLSDRGVMLLDDSLRERYQEGVDMMLAAGFRKLDFLGLKPGGVGAHQTTLFYRNDNCLGV